MDFLFDNLIAHRGFHNLEKNIPENSIKAFKEAIKNNYVIELDIHRTKDNKLVVFHDYNLKRVCGIDKTIESCTYKELSKLYLFNTSSKIPLFSEVLSQKPKCIFSKSSGDIAVLVSGGFFDL